MKQIITFFSTIVISGILITALINFMSSSVPLGTDGQTGSIFQALGVLTDSTINSVDAKHAEKINASEMSRSNIVVKYKGGIQPLFSYIPFKEMYEVTINEGPAYVATQGKEGGFQFVITDIRQNDISVLNKVTEDVFQEYLANVSTGAVIILDGTYKDNVYFFSDGIYIIKFAVRDENGYVYNYQTKIMVI